MLAKERVFPLKIALNGDCSLKEQCNKHFTGDEIRYKVLYALDSEFRIVEPVLYLDGQFVSVGQLAQSRGVVIDVILQEMKHDGKGVYYPLSALTYVCQHTILEEQGVLKNNLLSLFIPINVKKNPQGGIEGLVCSDVTTAIPFQTRKVLAENYLMYAKSRF